MNNKTKQAFMLVGIGLELSSLQANNWQSFLPLFAGMALICFVMFHMEIKKD